MDQNDLASLGFQLGNEREVRRLQGLQIGNGDAFTLHLKGILTTLR